MDFFLPVENILFVSGMINMDPNDYEILHELQNMQAMIF